MYSREFQRREIEFYAALTVGIAEQVRALGKFLIPMPQVLADNTGDFAGGYVINWLLNSTMDLTPTFRRIPEKTRIRINAGITLGVVTAVEVFPIFGEPRIEDIPAGVLGILASYGIRRLAQRWVENK